MLRHFALFALFSLPALGCTAQKLADCINEINRLDYSGTQDYFVKKGNAYQWNAESSFDLSMQNDSRVSLIRSDWGTSYSGQTEMHYLLLASGANPIVLQVQHQYGAGIERGYEDEDDDAPAQEVEYIRPRAVCEMDNAFMEFIVYQKNAGKWERKHNVFLPGDWCQVIEQYYPFARTQMAKHQADFSISYFDINTHQYWATVQSIYGFKKDETAGNMPPVELRFVSDKEIGLAFSPGHVLSLVWNGGRFEWKKPARIPPLEEPANAFGLSVKSPLKTLEFQGKINDQTAFSMRLSLRYTILSGEYSTYTIFIENGGKYWYSDPNKTMSVRGSISGNSKGTADVYLERLDDSYNIKETFRGKVNASGKRIEGTWEHVGKGTAQPFYMEWK